MNQSVSCNAARHRESFWSCASAVRFCRPTVTQKRMHSPDESKTQSTPTSWDNHAPGSEANPAKLHGSFCALIIKISGQSLGSLQLVQGSWAGRVFPALLEAHKHRRICLPGLQLCSVSGSLGPESKALCQAPTATQSHVPLGSPALAKCLLRYSRIHHERSSLRLQEWWSWHRPVDHPVRPPHTQSPA